MNKCENCNVIVYDETSVCPLCHSVLEEVEQEEKSIYAMLKQHGAPYPNVRRRTEINFVPIYCGRDWSDCGELYCDANLLVVRN